MECVVQYWVTEKRGDVGRQRVGKQSTPVGLRCLVLRGVEYLTLPSIRLLLLQRAGVMTSSAESKNLFFSSSSSSSWCLPLQQVDTAFEGGKKRFCESRTLKCRRRQNISHFCLPLFFYDEKKNKTGNRKIYTKNNNPLLMESVFSRPVVQQPLKVWSICYLKGNVTEFLCTHILHVFLFFSYLILSTLFFI